MTYELKTEFSCAHLYHQDQWTTEENIKKFGKCFSDFGHGHDYVLKVVFTDLDKNINKLKSHQEAMSKLKELLDHKHLNFTIAEFKNKIPTTENISLFCYDYLVSILAKEQIRSLKLFERSDLWVELSFLNRDANC